MFSSEEYEKAHAEHVAQHERQVAEGDLAVHLMSRVLHDLDEEQCVAIVHMLKGIRSAGNYSSPESVSAAFYIGILMSRLHTDFDRCLACGKKHDEELLGDHV